MDIQIIRSRRKSLALQVKNSRVIVRAPLHVSQAYIQAFVKQQNTWIQKQLQSQEEQQKELDAIEKLSAEELTTLTKQAKDSIPIRCEYFARLLGVSYSSITIRHQKTRWGSCSAKGNLNFNCLLMLAPDEVRDSVIVHELCHRLEMNHSQRFYDCVNRVYPEYDQAHGWLKKNGAKLLARLPEKEQG